MKILMATSEFSPLGSTGDLGDQIRILSVELKRLGHDVSVVMPFYRPIREGNYDIRPTGLEFQINLGGKRASTDIVETTGPEQIQVFLVRRDEYFDRSGIYGGDGRAYEDNAERFIFFAKAAIELARRLSPSPELIHCHDWTTALIPVFVRDRQLAFLTVLTIHNLEHQGSFWSFDFGLTGLPGSYFGPRGLEFYGRLNFLKSGILYADAVTLPGEVSLFEAFNPQHGFGLDAVLQENRFRTYGIPHGVDYSQTNPSLDKLLGRRYKSEEANAKLACRKALSEQLELENNSNSIALALPIEPQDELAFGSVKPVLDLRIDGRYLSGCDWKSAGTRLGRDYCGGKKISDSFRVSLRRGHKVATTRAGRYGRGPATRVTWFPGCERGGIDAVRNLADREDSRWRASARFRL